jgi:hypothetical protein
MAAVQQNKRPRGRTPPVPVTSQRNLPHARVAQTVTRYPARGELAWTIVFLRGGQGMTKKWSARLALTVTAGAVIVALSSAPVAAATCPAPGTGLPGALNMIADASMLTVPMARDAAQGNAGMNTAVTNSGC